MTRYGVRVDDHHHGYVDFTIWSGSFMSTLDGHGVFRDGAKRTTVTTYNQEKVIVHLPDGLAFPRTDENYEAIDAVINEALNEYEKARKSVQLEVAP